VKSFDNELILKKVQMPNDVNMQYEWVDQISEKLYIKVEKNTDNIFLGLPKCISVPLKYNLFSKMSIKK
jgi:hypothetical protein